MRKNPKVSIMVVAYNTEPYIGACLESLRIQTFADIEVICVNDGSTDRTESIISEYVTNDPRFKLFNLLKNSGISVARNKALSECVGEFHAELDSDDWYDSDTIELAVKAMEENEACDLVLYDVVCYDQSTGVRKAFESRGQVALMSGREAFEKSLDWSIHGYYMVRASAMEGVRYDETTSVSDENTCRLLFLRSRKVVQCVGRYYYRQHSESIMQKCTMKQFDMLVAHVVFRPSVVSLNEERLVSLFDNYRWAMFISKWYYYMQYSSVFSSRQQNRIEECFQIVYKTFEYGRLSPRFCKFGFYSFNGHYTLFRMNTWIYFQLKQIFNKL